MNKGKDIEQAMRDARWNMRDLQIIAETTRQNGMVWIPDVLEETANNIEYLLMELEKGQDTSTSKTLNGILTDSNTNYDKLVLTVSKPMQELLAEEEEQDEEEEDDATEEP